MVGIGQVVFRFHADWKPDQMEKMVKLRTIVESILMQTRDGNPQERYPELVDAATGHITCPRPRQAAPSAPSYSASASSYRAARTSSDPL